MGLPKVLGFGSEALHAYRGRSKGVPKQLEDDTGTRILPPGTYAPSSYYGENGSELPNGYTAEDGSWIPSYFYTPDGSWIPNDAYLPADLVPRTPELETFGTDSSSGNSINRNMPVETGLDSKGQDHDGIDNDEAVWQLDDIAESLQPPGYEEAMNKETANDENECEQTEDAKIKKREKLVRDLINIVEPAPSQIRRLPCAVIIPQRRPGKKDRGFCRAYAPILAESGIDQDTFLQFIQSFDVASKANPLIEVTFIAGGILGMVPNATAAIAGAIVQVVAGTAKELQARNRANTFLDRVNQEIFMPRGLVVMVMAFEDDKKLGFASLGKLFQTKKVDINDPNAGDVNQNEINPYDHLTDAALANNTPQMGEGWWKRNMKKIRETDGKTTGDVQLPESAPLVYPYLDAVLGRSGEPPQGFKKKMGAAGEWVQDYMDRKSHADLEQEKPGTALAMSADQRKPFKSRFNDPSHPANSGSLISLVTGGAIAMPDRKQMMMDKGKKGFRMLKGEQEPAENQQQQNRRWKKASSGGLIKTVMKMKQDDIFYLTVINMPTPEEIEAAKAEMREMMVDFPPEAQSAVDTKMPYSPDDLYPAPLNISKLPSENIVAKAPTELPAELTAPPVAISQASSTVVHEQH
ncbi:hypothetical protein N7478_005747 [Penicillium angulare]|uniref:uncharacterized protein n=1 Tax=Penicillium angulare TaxID=116970 RepID=UPI002540941B|nr:uncharacterized protein N7478_005747 [Penicillium angulare]KAJ5280375.1 hypothetical protein N7478_005747 [Penicillium angulare]